MKETVLPCFLSVAIMAFAAPAAATPIRFEITGGSATTSGLSVGSTVAVVPSAGLAQVFYLNTGQTSGPINFLDVTVSGMGVAGGFIDAALNFADPTTATANGVLAGFSVILGIFSGGTLQVVNDPGPIAFGDGGLFDVDFLGFSSVCTYCTTLSGTVTATVSLIRAPNAVSVSEPATLSMLGAGLLILGAVLRRRRSA